MGRKSLPLIGSLFIAASLLAACGGSSDTYTIDEMADVFDSQTGLCQGIQTSPTKVTCLREDMNYIAYAYESEETMRKQYAEACADPPLSTRVWGENWQVLDNTNRGNAEALEYLQSLFGGEIMTLSKWCLMGDDGV